jgi:hypothetical protein
MADIQVLNTDSDLSGNTLLTEEEAYTITGLHTYNRGTNPPFAVHADSTKVDNLDADKLDGQTGTYYLAAANATGTLSVAQGGTGATSLTDGGLLLGSGTGALTALGVAANGQIPIGDGSGDPQLATISGTSNQIDVTNGAASITLSLSSSYVGQTSITTLGTIATGTWEGTDIGVAHGGTGVSTLTDGGILLGSGTGAITALGVATNGQIPIGDGSGDPQLATISGTSNQIDVTNGAGSITLALSSSYVGQTSITTLGTIGTGTWEGTDVAVAHGGTGASSLTDGGILLGSGTGAITALGVATNGQIPIGDGSGDPVLATISGTSNQVDVTNGAGSITLSLSSSYVGQTSITTLGTIATGTWEGTDVAVAHGGTGASSLTDNAILMGNGTSAVTPGSGLYGYDSTAALRIEGADPYLSLKETTNTKEWKIQVVDDSSESLIQIPTPTGGTTTDWILRTWYNGATDYRASTTDNIRLFNADGTSERLRLGTSGVSFDGGSNYLDDYEEGTYTPYLYGSTTGNTGDSTYRITGTQGVYSKVGRLVHVFFRFDSFTVPTNATGLLAVTVPFTAGYGDVGGAPLMNLMNISTNCTYSVVTCNSDHFRIYSVGDDVAYDVNDITDTSGAGRLLWASFTYQTS